jgi:hypothetical protein
MEGKHLQAGLLAGGVVLLAQTFVDAAPPGPWDSSSFTRGVLGLLGMLMLYFAWFRHTFGFYGVAPTVDRWSDPATSWSHVVIFGLGCVVMTRLIRLFDQNDIFPAPAGLLLLLVGVLAMMNGLYVWAITHGPLLEEE